MIPRIAVTGIGAITPVGAGRERLWESLLAGRLGFAPVSSFDTTAFNVHLGAEVRGWNPAPYAWTLDPGTMGRASQMAIGAARLALVDAGFDEAESAVATALTRPGGGLARAGIGAARAGVAMGTTSGEPLEIERCDNHLLAGEIDRAGEELMTRYPCHLIAAHVARELGFAGVNAMLPAACAAGNYALAHAVDQLRSGRADLMLAGGADAFSRITYSGFARLGAIAPERCQPFDRGRKGMIPGEGAAVLVLEPLDKAQARGARIYAEVAGYGLSCDAHHMTAAHPEGEGARRAMCNALADAGLAPADVSYISAHGTGTPTNDRLETLAVGRVFGAGARVPISSVKSMIGHTMGAASAIEAAVCALAVATDRIPPTMGMVEPEGDLDYVPNQAREHRVEVAMNNAYAFGGNNGSTIFRKCGAAAAAAPRRPAADGATAPPRRRVVVTGAGVISPLGDSPAAVHAALGRGTSARRPIELFPTAQLGAGVQEGGEIQPFEPQTYVGERNLRPLDRTSRLLVVAAQLALADAGWSDEARTEREVGLLAGTTFCSLKTIAEFDRRAKQLGPTHASPFDFANSVINAAAGQTAIWHRLRGVNSTLAAGEASGLMAIAQATELVRAGRADAMLAGGVEELCFESLLGYHRAGRLCGSMAGAAAEAETPAARPVPFDARRNGYSLSEGAGLLVLEEAAAAAARGAAVRAEVLGWGAAFAPGREDDAVAAAVARAVRLALADAGVTAGDLAFLSASASGSRAVDRAEALGVAAGLAPIPGGPLDLLGRSPLGDAPAAGGDAAPPPPLGLPVTAIKAMLGEGMAASGAWQAIDLLETLADGALPGIAGLERVEPGLPVEGAGEHAGVAATVRQLAPAPPGRRRVALATAVSADGHCAALILGAVEAAAS